MSDTISKYETAETTVTSTTTTEAPMAHTTMTHAGDEAAKVAHAEANKNFLRHADLKDVADAEAHRRPDGVWEKGAHLEREYPGPGGSVTTETYDSTTLSYPNPPAECGNCTHTHHHGRH